MRAKAATRGRRQEGVRGVFFGDNPMALLLLALSLSLSHFYSYLLAFVYCFNFKLAKFLALFPFSLLGVGTHCL